MEHTKEPWCVGQGIDADLILDADGSLICANCVSAEIARRIVACVNACARFATDDLERFPLVSEHGFALYESVKKQRDELLEALILAVEDEPNACFAEHARSVIAKATGETK